MSDHIAVAPDSGDRGRMMAGAFIKRPGMYLVPPIRFDRATTFIDGYLTAVRDVRYALSDPARRGEHQPAGVVSEFSEQLREEGRLRWDRWDLTIAAEAIGWTDTHPPVIDDFTEEQHRAALAALRPLMERLFVLPDAFGHSATTSR